MRTTRFRLDRIASATRNLWLSHEVIVGDEIVPARRPDALRPEVGNMVLDRTIAGAGHNEIYGRSDFQAAMHEALNAVIAGKK